MSAFSGNVITPEAEGLVPEAVAAKAIASRTLRSLAWSRLKQDKLALAGGVIVVVLIILAILAAPICHLLGISPIVPNPKLINPDTSLPIGNAGGMSWDHPLGIATPFGEDLLARILYGAQVSLFIAITSTVVSMLLGVAFGIVAGYKGGWIDAIISRAMDILLAFPVLLFSIALLAIFQGIDGIHVVFFKLGGTSLRISLLITIIGFFGWAYIGRVIRGQVHLACARRSSSTRPGASAPRIAGSSSAELLPNLAGPDARLRDAHDPYQHPVRGRRSPTSASACSRPRRRGARCCPRRSKTFQVDPEYMIVPGLAIFITVLSFNLFGDGLRDALDPKSNR